MTQKIFISIAVFMALLSSCTKDFQSININPNAPASVSNNYLLSESEVMLAGSQNPDSKSWRVNFGSAACMVQQMSSTDISFYGGSFYTSTQNNFSAYFEDAYPNSIKSLVNLISLSADPKYVNVLAIARILKVMDFAKMTDIHGDVPYYEAGLAFIKVNFIPKYDAQKDIYTDMLNELDKAGTALSSSATSPGAADYIYSGDVNKWKRAANTLMLRLAMRLQKIDDATAKTWASKAIAGGLIANGENIAINFDGTTQISANPNSWILGPSGRNIASINGVLWGKTLIDMMKARKDPRLPVIANLKNGDTTTANQVGLPNGTNVNILATLTPSSLDGYSRPAAGMFKNSNSWIYMTYAESQLLLAEAIERGYVSGTALTAFTNGQTAAVNQVSVYGITPPPAAVANYASVNPYPAAGTLDQKMNAIHSELYLLHAVTLNHIEAWSNWRRTNYPLLVPVNPVGNETNGTIPRRLKYSPGEFGVNPYVADAIARQGPDLYTTRIWWDK